MAIKYSMRDLIRDVIHLCSRIGKISVALYTGWSKIWHIFVCLSQNKVKICRSIYFH